MKPADRIKKNRCKLLILFLVLAVQSVFISRKEGYHMDELLSFELSNAQYNPWIVPTQPVGRLAKFMDQEIEGEDIRQTLGNLWDAALDVIQNRGESRALTYQADVYPEPVWITRQQFHEYLTVGEKDAFNYFSVYFNVKDDNHPPVHFMLLHTVSSLLRERIFPFMGCVINLAAVLGCCGLMMGMGELLERNGRVREGARWGCLAAALYGFSSGAVATVLLIRMYALLTLWCVLTLYLHLKKWLEGSFAEKNKGLIAVTVLGFLTQYFFLLYCILLAAVTFVLCLRKGRRREAFCYLRSMGAAAVIGVGIFPFSVGDVLSSGRGVEAIGNLTSGLGGYGERLRAFGEILLVRGFGEKRAGLVLALLLLAAAAVWRLWRWDRGREICWMLLLPPAGYFLLAAKMSPYLVDRYVMPVFPFLSMLLAGVLAGLAGRIFGAGKEGRRKRGVLLFCIACGLAALQVRAYDGEYLYRGYEGQLETAVRYRELPCICVYEGYGFYDNLLEFQTYERTLLLKPEELRERRDASDLESLERAVVLVKQNVDAGDVLRDLASRGLEAEELPVESPYGDRVYLCRRAG